MQKINSQQHQLLSVIVPAYKQERTIQKDLENIITTLEQGLTNTNFEVVCIVDGELDNTYEEACKVKSEKLKK